MVGPCSEGPEEKPKNREISDQNDKILGCLVSESGGADAVRGQISGWVMIKTQINLLLDQT